MKASSVRTAKAVSTGTAEFKETGGRRPADSSESLPACRAAMLARHKQVCGQIEALKAVKRGVETELAAIDARIARA